MFFYMEPIFENNYYLYTKSYNIFKIIEKHKIFISNGKDIKNI